MFSYKTDVMLGHKESINTLKEVAFSQGTVSPHVAVKYFHVDT